MVWLGAGGNAWTRQSRKQKAESRKGKKLTRLRGCAFEPREAYGVRAACCRFRSARDVRSLRVLRKRQQAARTPYASRVSDAPDLWDRMIFIRIENFLV